MGSPMVLSGGFGARGAAWSAARCVMESGPGYQRERRGLGMRHCVGDRAVWAGQNHYVDVWLAVRGWRCRVDSEQSRAVRGNNGGPTHGPSAGRAIRPRERFIRLHRAPILCWRIASAAEMVGP